MQGEVNAGNEFYRGNLPAATSSAERMFLSREYESRCGICREVGLIPARRHSLRVKLGGTRDGEMKSRRRGVSLPDRDDRPIMAGEEEKY